MPNCRKNTKKRQCAQKSTKNPRLERSFSPKNIFSGGFWAPSGSIGASRDVPGASQKPLIFHKFWVASANRPGPASGRPQRGPGCHPDTSPAQFCVDFGAILRIDFDIHSFGDVLIFWVKCSCFYSFGDALIFRMKCSCFGVFFCTFRLCTWLWRGRPWNSR